jgi:hypothetical protein
MTISKLIERLQRALDSDLISGDTFVLSWDDTPDGLGDVDDVTLAEIRHARTGTRETVVLLRVVQEVDGRPSTAREPSYSLARDLPCPQ